MTDRQHSPSNNFVFNIPSVQENRSVFVAICGVRVFTTLGANARSQELEGKIFMRKLKTLTAAVLPVLLIAGMAMSLAACNTVSGAGKDVSAGGSAVTTGADKVKDKL
jgi:entericidin B